MPNVGVCMEGGRGGGGGRVMQGQPELRIHSSTPPPLPLKHQAAHYPEDFLSQDQIFGFWAEGLVLEGLKFARSAGRIP